MLLARRLMTGVCVGVATKVSNPFRPGRPAVLDVHELIHAHELRVPTADVDNAAMIPGDGVAMPSALSSIALFPVLLPGVGRTVVAMLLAEARPAAPPVHRTDLEGQQRVDSGHLTILKTPRFSGRNPRTFPITFLLTWPPPRHHLTCSRPVAATTASGALGRREILMLRSSGHSSGYGERARIDVALRKQSVRAQGRVVVCVSASFRQAGFCAGVAG